MKSLPELAKYEVGIVERLIETGIAERLVRVLERVEDDAKLVRLFTEAFVSFQQKNLSLKHRSLLNMYIEVCAEKEEEEREEKREEEGEEGPDKRIEL